MATDTIAQAGRTPPRAEGPGPASALPRSEQRRRRILRGAIRVIAQGGLDSLTHRRVAAEAGVPLGSTTYYFRSRDDLVREAFRHYLDHATAWMTSLAGDMTLDTSQGLVDYLVELVRREFDDPDLVRAEYELILAASRDEALASDLRDWERTVIANLAESLEGLGVARPMDAARTLLHLMRGFELERLTRTTDPADLGRRLAGVLSAWTSPPAS